MKRSVIEGCVVCRDSAERLRKRKVPLLVRNGVGICRGCLLQMTLDCSRGTGLIVMFRNGEDIRLIENGAFTPFTVNDADALRAVTQRVFLFPRETQRHIPMSPAQEQEIEESKFGAGGLNLGRPHPSP